ncbi:MAG: tRNA dihydrouridine synthase DusB [Pseudomonadota bacterium]
MTLSLGPNTLRNRVAVAPMSGVSDLAFRAAAWRGGAGLVVSEMVASEELVRARPDVVRRAEGGCGAGRPDPFVIQLAGREARWMAEGARLTDAAGADVIDINMGCPSRQVTGGLSGSALMRDPDRALTLIEAVLGATDKPVTLKMRLGWDHNLLTAPEIAARAEAAGIAMFTVHGRTRNQFYKGTADWAAVAATRAVITRPLLVNGDIETLADARAALAQSGADGVMIGRATIGKPWLAGAMARALEAGAAHLTVPDLATQTRQMIEHYRATLALYGDPLGIRMARKHLAAFIDQLTAWLEPAAQKALRQQLCTSASPKSVTAALEALGMRAEAGAAGHDSPGCAVPA